MTVFGNGAIWVDGQTGGILTQAAAETEKLLFLFLDQFPLALVTSLIALLVIVIFFITSADSGIFVINSIASQGKGSFPKWQTVLWEPCFPAVHRPGAVYGSLGLCFFFCRGGL